MLKKQNIDAKLPKIGIFQWLNDRIFGYDFFISYSHSDGLKYPSAIQERLKQIGFKVFLDKNVYVAGIDLRLATVRRVSMSRKLIVIARPAALDSKWVYREVEVYLKKGSPPILINVNHSIEKAPQNSLLADLALNSHWLRIEEQLLDFDSIPSDQCIYELSRSFNATRVETRRSRIFGATALAFALIALFASWQAYIAVTQRNRAEMVLDRVTKTSNDLVFELAQEFKGRLGIPQALIINILDHAKTLVDELAKKGEARPDIVLSQGIALVEMSSTLRSQGLARQAVFAAETAVAIFENLSKSLKHNLELENYKAASYDRLGDAYIQIEEYDKALSAYEKSYLISSNLVNSNQEEMEWQNNLAVSYEKIGDISLHSGNLAEAFEKYLKSQEIRAKLIDINPSHTEWKRNLAVLFAKNGKILFKQKKISEALEKYQQSLSISEQISAANPSRADWLRDLSVSYQEVGDVLTFEEKYLEALVFYKKDIEIAKKLYSTDPSRLDYQNDLIESHNRIGTIYYKTGDIAKSLEAYEHALLLANEVAAIDRSRQYWQKQLSILYQKVALVLFEIQRYQEALLISEENLRALQIYSNLGIDVNLDLADAYNNISWYAIFVGDYTKALKYSELAIDLAPEAISYKLNKAHVFMFLKNFSEAISIYLSYMEEPLNESMSWKDAVLSDFNAFKKANLDSPLMEKVINELTGE